MFSHSVFSLSFTVLATLVASRGIPKTKDAGLILLAFLGGRTCANALNRVVDRNYDGLNERTARRHIPGGSISVHEALVLAAFSFFILCLAAFLLNPLCVALLPLAAFLFIAYSFTKRFTWLCHFILGVTCAGASVGAWIALRGRFEWPIFILAAANSLWVMGFDVVYAIQDMEFDRRVRLKSIPARFGSAIARLFSAASHAFAIAALLVFAYITGLGWVFYMACVLAGLSLFTASILIHIDNQKYATFAAYSVNKLVSILLMAGISIDILILSTRPQWLPLNEFIALLGETLL
jgi:4-hydroxybenzoate polyprenyltransferase